MSETVGRAEGGPIRLTVAPADAGRAALDLAAEALGSEREARAALAHGGLWRNRARLLDGGARLEAGDTLFIHQPPGGVYAEVALEPARILFEDAWLIAVDKPPGVYVESTPWDAGGHLRGAVEALLASRSATETRERTEIDTDRGDGDRAVTYRASPSAGTSAPAVAKVHLAHRLDRDTSGVLLLSKDPAANPALQRAFVEGLVHKQYLCACAGEPPEDEFRVSTGHGRARQGLWHVYPAEEIGRELPGGARVKSMVTRFEVLRRLGGAALLRAFPITGRTHQIRLHLAHLGHPLLGDARYGGPAEWRGLALPHHLLHAERLALPHPISGAPLAISAPLPSGVWDDLRG